MNILFCIFTFLICEFKDSISIEFYSLEEIFKIINNLNETEENLNLVIENLSEILNKVYVYNEVSKNPPQPEFNKTYYTRINIQEQLKNINTKNANIYNFYRDIKLILNSLGDYHLNFGINNILKNIRILEPFSYRIELYNNEYRIFANLDVGEKLLSKYRNYEKIIDIIKNNTNIPILSINGKNPFDYITNFGGNIKKLKSPQASFRFKFISRNEQSLEEFPLTIEELSNLTIIYDNDDEIITDYLVYSMVNLNETEFIKENKFFILNNKNEKNNKIKFDLKNSILFNNIKNNLIKNENKIVFKKSDNNLNEIEWDYKYMSDLGCKADISKKINIYFVNSFISYESGEYINTLYSCIDLFDSNDYPIILISILNQGGSIYNAQLLLELLSPTTTINIYGALRNNGIYKEEEIEYELLSQFSDYENCQTFTYEKFEKMTKKIDYGENIIDYLSGPVILNGKDFRKEINSLKKKLKNPRKPTDIIVYTDGYSFSAGAMLTKYLQYYGGAITAGYFPNPYLKKNFFDNGSCASVLYSFEILENFNFEEYNKLTELNYPLLSVPRVQLFFEPNNLNRPLEYEIKPVDEIVYIYPKLENLFNILLPEDYDKFINESYKIFEKYKTKCNPNNTKLILLTDKCNGKFGNNFTYGGYKCGNDGYWTEECVASHCEFGYIFDYNSNKCIVDACSDEKIMPEPKPEPNTKPNPDLKSNNNIIIIFSVIIGIIAISIFILIFLFIKQKKSKETNELISSVENISEEIISKENK